MRHIIKLMTLSLLLTANLQAVVQEVKQKDQEKITLTIYPTGQALVRDVRNSVVEAGSNRIIIGDIPKKIELDSVLLVAEEPKEGIEFKEYIVNPSQITHKMLLSHCIDEDVFITDSKPEKEKVKLLAIEGDNAIVEGISGIFMVNADKIGLYKLPYVFSPKPTISTKLISNIKGPLAFNVIYLAHGISWTSSYTVIVNHDGSSLDINNWIKVSNNSGASFRKAKIRIAEGMVEEENVVYPLSEQVSIADGSSKNLAWLSAQSIPASHRYRVYPKVDINENEEGMVIRPRVENWLSVVNNKKNGLGNFLPAGSVRAFQRTADGKLTYLADNKTPQINPNGEFSLKLGYTKDMVAEMRQTDFRRLSQQVVETGYSLNIKNQTDKPQEITVVQEIPGDWAILRESHNRSKSNSNSAEWVIKIPPHEYETLKYRIRMNTNKVEDKAKEK